MVKTRQKNPSTDLLKCRGCLGQNGVIDLSENLDKKFQEPGCATFLQCFERSTGFPVKTDEPQALCSDCAKSLLTCHTFAVLTKKTQELLKGVEVKVEVDVKVESPHSHEEQIDFVFEDAEPVLDEEEKTDDEKESETKQMPTVDPELVVKLTDSALVCPFCPRHKAYRARHHVRRHIQRSHPDRINLPCQYCGRSFFFESMKEKHELRCSKGPMDYLNAREICPTCGKMIKRRDIKNHIRRYHAPETQTDPFICDLCNKKFKTRCIIANHIKIVHLKVEQTRFCHICSESFKSSDALNTHMRRDHQAGPELTCDLCEYSTYVPRNLRRHKRRHANIRNHRCEICGYRVDGADKLRDHMASHSDERQHVCTVCGASYKTRTSFHVHSLTHKGIIYNCPVCNTEFKNRRAYRDHIKTKHPEIPVPRYGTKNRGNGLKLVITKSINKNQSAEEESATIGIHPNLGTPDLNGPKKEY